MKRSSVVVLLVLLLSVLSIKDEAQQIVGSFFKQLVEWIHSKEPPVPDPLRVITPEMVMLKKGCYLMGSPPKEKDRKRAEGPQHKVCLDAFSIGKYEVTQKEWQKVMDYNPSQITGCDSCPVDSVSWNEVEEFIEALNRNSGKNYRLPTEAEWEYAAKAGTTGAFSFQGKIDAKKANYDARTSYAGSKKGGYRKKTVPVGSFSANPWGLYDMHGNVWEWTQDCWHHNYKGAPTDGSAWLEDKCLTRVLRGGSWDSYPSWLRSSFRSVHFVKFRFNLDGFRLVLPITNPQ